MGLEEIDDDEPDVVVPMTTTGQQGGGDHEPRRVSFQELPLEDRAPLAGAAASPDDVVIYKVGDVVQTTTYGVGTIVEKLQEIYRVELSSFGGILSAPSHSIQAKIHDAIPKFPIHATVETLYGIGNVKSYAKGMYTVKLPYGTLYAQEATIFKTTHLAKYQIGHVVHTPYGQGRITQFREEDGLYTIQLLHFGATLYGTDAVVISLVPEQDLFDVGDIVVTVYGEGKITAHRDRADGMYTVKLSGMAGTYLYALKPQLKKKIPKQYSKEDIPVLLDLMMNNPSAAHHQSNGCQGLLQLASASGTDSANNHKRIMTILGAIPAVLAALEEHPRTAKVQINACAFLGVLAHGGGGGGGGNIEEYRTAIAEAGGIQAILKSSSMHRHNPHLQASACGALWNLAFNSSENQKTIIDENGLQAIVQGMSAGDNSKHVKCQENACIALKILAEHDDKSTTQGLIVFAGGIDAIAKGMKAHATNGNAGRMQEKATYLLWKFAADSKDNQEAIANGGGGVEAIVAAMEGHPDNATVQSNCCGALWNLAGTEATAVMIADEGGIAAICQAMKNHPDNVVLQASACGALWIMACANKMNKTEISEEDGIQAIFDAMRNHPSSTSVQENATGALKNLAFTHDNRSLIAELDGIDILIKTMQARSDNAHICENVCGAFWNLASNHNENKDRIADAGGIRAVLQAMADHATTAPKVQFNACGALWNLAAGNAHNRQQIASHHGIPAILTAMRNHSGQANVQSTACGALAVLSVSNDENRILIAKKGGIDVILAAMRRHATDAKVQAHGCGALSNLAFHSKNNILISVAGGIKVILDAMVHFKQNSHVQASACSCLYTLADHSVENSGLISKVGGKGPIRAAMAAHPHDHSLQKSAQDALDRLP